MSRNGCPKYPLTQAPILWLFWSETNQTKRQSSFIRRVVAVEEAQAFAKKNGLFYIESSAKEAINVDEVFNKVADEILGGILSKKIDPKNEVRWSDWNQSGRRAEDRNKRESGASEKNGGATLL